MRLSGRPLWILPALIMTTSLTLPAQYRRDRDRDHDRRRDYYDQRDSSSYGRAREMVGRVMRDLNRAERFSRPEGREKERFDNAQRHLSQFDRKLTRGDFDKDKLDEAIDDVKNVVENNTLPPQAREELSRDLADLRHLRSVRGRL